MLRTAVALCTAFLVLAAAHVPVPAGAQDRDAPRTDEVTVPKGQLLDAPSDGSALSRLYRRTDDGAARASSASVVYEQAFTDPTGLPDGWAAEGPWGAGRPASGPDGGASDAVAAGTALSGTYANGTDARLVSPSVRLPGDADRLVLRVREWFRIESGYDRGQIEVSTDDGRTWRAVSGRSGQSPWRDHVVDLSAYAGETVRLAFRLQTDASRAFAGWYLDDLQILRDRAARTNAAPSRAATNRTTASIQPKATTVDSLTARITSLNPQEFPYVFANVAVDTSGGGVSSLTADNFSVYENGTLQTDDVTVTPPEESGGVRRVDVVFLMDNSGSMGGEQSAVRNNMIAFVDSLSASGVDFALGLTRFGASANSGYPILADNGTLTSDADYFKNDVWARNTIDGGFEPGWDALYESATGFSFRPGAQRVFILITDESVTGNGNRGTYAKSETEQVLLNQSVTNYALIETSDPSSVQDYGEIAEATGGRAFDITSPFNDILDGIGAEVASTYVVSYRALNDAPDGTERTVRVEARYEGLTAGDTTTYVAGGYPEIVRTDSTRALGDSTWAQGASLDFGVVVRDRAEPFVQDVTLFHRTGSEVAYTPLPMTAQNDSLYTATLSGSDVADPSLDYYVTATDGEVTASLPSTNPSATPFQIAVLPNTPPRISALTTSGFEPGAPITVEATMVDTTNRIDATALYARRIGRLSYTELEMTNVSGDRYRGTIPDSLVTETGVQFYVEATDDYGVRSTQGTADDPITLRTTRPAAPPSLEATVQNNAVALNWEASPSADVGRYRIYRSAAPLDAEAGPSALAAYDSTGAGTTAFTDADVQKEETYYYRVTAVDTSANESVFSPEALAFLYPAFVQAQINEAFGEGRRTADYRLVALPGDERATGQSPGAATESVTLREVLPGAESEVWRAFWDDGTATDYYVEHDSSATFDARAGRGYWVLSSERWVETSTYTTVDLRGDSVAVVDLHDGWNIIANPTGKDIPWADVRAENGLPAKGLFAFTGSFSQRQTLASARTGEAYYYLNDTGQQALLLPYPGAPGYPSTAALASKQATEAGLVLRATQGERDTARVELRFAEGAEAGLDPSDVIAPTSRFSSLSLHVQSPAADPDPRRDRLAVDRRPGVGDGQEYALRLRGRGEGPVRLQAETVTGLETASVALEVPGRERPVDLRRAGGVTLTPGDEPLTLTLTVGAGPLPGAKSAAPAEVALSTYPTPAQSEATLEFALPERTDVRLEVYDVLGRTVATLVDGEKTTGRHRVRLDLDGLASGLYFGRLQAGNTTRTQKIVVVR